LNPEVLGSFWLKASATWGGTLRQKASVMGRLAVPLFLFCPDIRLTSEEKHGKPQSGQPSSPGTMVFITTVNVHWYTLLYKTVEIISVLNKGCIKLNFILHIRGHHAVALVDTTINMRVQESFEDRLLINKYTMLDWLI
jgi:hypothetical protein